MLTKTKKLMLFAALFLVGGAAGCSGNDDPTVATAASGAPTAGATAAGDDQASPLRYAKCMRDQGLSWFPDPGADGGLRVSVPDGQQDRFDQAQEKCKAYEPGTNQNAVPLGKEDLAKLRQVSQCIRDHGFEKFPDPDANGGVAIDSRTTGISPEDPEFEKARQDCAKHMPQRKAAR